MDPRETESSAGIRNLSREMAGDRKFSGESKGKRLEEDVPVGLWELRNTDEQNGQRPGMKDGDPRVDLNYVLLGLKYSI